MHKSVIIKIIRMGRARRSGGANGKVMDESILQTRGRDGLAKQRHRIKCWEGLWLLPYMQTIKYMHTHSSTVHTHD